MIKVLLLTFGFILSTNSFCHPENSASGEGPVSILFIGSSYFNYNNLPGLINELAVASNQELHIDQNIPGGLYLADHVENATTLAKIKERDWDYVILQGVGRLTAYPETYKPSDIVYQAILSLSNTIKTNCATSIIVFCMPWAFEDGMTWIEGGTDLFKDMQIKIYDNTLHYSSQIGFSIAPVGWAWLDVLEEMNYPLHYLHLSDWNHPSIKGSYLTACVVYSTIFRELPISDALPENLTVEEASYFKEVAISTVLDSNENWNPQEVSVSIHDVEAYKGFSLDQNFPNPFCSTTQISYEMHRAGSVEISVFNNPGNLCRIVDKGYKLPGTYTVELNGSSLPPGLLYYSVKCDDLIQTRRMLLLK